MIITSWEVINNTPVSNRIEQSKISNQIDFIEEAQFRDYFSIPFLKLLISDLNYNESTAFEWEPSQEYVVGEKCFNKGLLYQLASANSLGEEPQLSAGIWFVINKFKTAKYQQLWDLYLCKYLSNVVMFNCIDFIHSQIEAGGVVKLSSSLSNLTAADTKVVNNIKGQFQINYQMILENMKAWLSTDDENYNWSSENIKLLKDGKSIDREKRRGTRFFFSEQVKNYNSEKCIS